MVWAIWIRNWWTGNRPGVFSKINFKLNYANIFWNPASLYTRIDFSENFVLQFNVGATFYVVEETFS